MKRTILSLALVAFMTACVSRPTQQELASADYGSYPTEFEQIIKSFMQSTLKDPESARYQFLNSPKPAWGKSGGIKFGYVVCVNINAKNSYGGYVGNRLSYFMVRNGRIVDVSHGDGGRVGDGLVQFKCEPFI